MRRAKFIFTDSYIREYRTFSNLSKKRKFGRGVVAEDSRGESDSKGEGDGGGAEAVSGAAAKTADEEE